jgi:serine/threonine-protein kinase RsbW
MSEEPQCWERDFELPSERGASRAVLDELLARLGQFGWEQSDIFGVHLATEEAIVNAILHGNQLDPQKRVKVSCQVTPRRVRLEITDEGPGFKPETVPDCTREDRLDMPGGRGLLLMRSFMSKIEYNDRGNAVVLEKDLDAPPAAEKSDDD